MQHVFTGKYPNEMFKSVIMSVLDNGHTISPRGMPTKEIQPAVNIWSEPDKMVMTTPGRKANPFFTLFEALWIVGGRSDSESVCYYNKQLAQFLDGDYKEFHAPYGCRIRRWGINKEHIKSMLKIDEEQLHTEQVQHDQFADCYELLKRDPDTRQAVISLWIPPFDYSKTITNDRPCNDMIFFKARNGRLNMTVINRSNDLILGLYSVNVAQFTLLQRVLASCLGLKLGHYYHHSDSLHIYTDKREVIESVLNARYNFDVYNYVKPYDLSKEFLSLKEFDEQLKIFFELEQAFRTEIVTNDSLRTASKLKSRFLHGALCICESYILHKKKNYDESLSRLEKAYIDGLHDHVIACFEFLMRKYQSENIQDKMAEKIASILHTNLSPNDIVPILRYILEH